MSALFAQFYLVLEYAVLIVQANLSNPAGMPRSGKNIWKMKFFPGQGKVREFCGRPEKFRKDLESQGKVREFENKWLWQVVFRKFIYSVQEGEGCTFS